MSLGSRIKRVRKGILRVSQAELSRRLKLGNPGLLSKYETGWLQPKLEVLRQLSDIAGVSVGWLVSGEGGGAPELNQDKKLEKMLRKVERIYRQGDKVDKKVLKVVLDRLDPGVKKRPWKGIDE